MAVSRLKALADWSGFATSQYVARIASILRGFVVARLLGPTDYGSWVAVLVIYDLGAYIHLGILNGMTREIPFELGREEKEKAEAYRDSGYTAITVLTTLFLLVLLAVDLIGWKNHSPVTRVALPLIGIATALQIFCFVYHNIFRAYRRIGPISQAWVIQSLINVALSIGLVLVVGIYGMFLALVAANLLSLIFLRARADWRFRFRFDKALMAKLLVRGGPILAYIFAGVLLRQVDKLVIIGNLSRAELGYYGIASTIAGMLIYITSSASFTLFPEFLARFGKTGEIAALGRTLKEPTYAFSIFVPVFLGFAYLWIHIPVVHVLPKFVPGIAAMRVLVCGTLFLSIASLPSYFLITVNRTKVLLIGAAVLVVAEWGINTALARAGYGIQGIALGAALCQFLYGTTLLAFAFRLVPDDDGSLFMSLFRTYLPTLYVAAVVAFLFRFLPIDMNATLADDLKRGLLHGAILLASTSPLWWQLQRRTGVFTLAWQMISGKGRGRSDGE